MHDPHNNNSKHPEDNADLDTRVEANMTLVMWNLKTVVMKVLD